MYTINRIPLVLALGLLGACASYSNVRFDPNPLDVSLSHGEGGEPLGRALISLRSIREVENEAKGEDTYELPVVLRLDNEGTTAVQLLPAECELVDASLDSLPPPRIERRSPHGDDPLDVAAGETAVFELSFPFPPGRDPGDYDLQGLNLRWALEDGERTVHVSSTFERIQPRYEPYYAYGYYPWFGYYGSYGYHGWHCH